MTEASALRFKTIASCLLTLIPPGSQSTQTGVGGWGRSVQGSKMLDLVAILEDHGSSGMLPEECWV